MNPLAPLERYTPRTLNLIASLISGQETRVALSRRLLSPGVAVLESRTVMLDPDRTNLYDLVLCARLLQYRPQRRRESEDTVPVHQVCHWTRRAHLSLRRDYPGILRLPGTYTPDNESQQPEIVWRTVDYRPMDPDEGNQGIVGAGVPGVEFTGTNEDHAWVLSALQAGRLPTEQVRGLDGMDVATVPLNLTFSHTYGPRIEALERYIADGRDTINGLVNCYQRKSETLQNLVPSGARTPNGTILDSTRLVDAVTAWRTGITPRLFKKRSATFQPVFDPHEHLVVMALDLNDLHGGTLEQPSFSHRFLAWLIKVYQILEVDFAVLGFADRLVELEDGRRVYLHAPLMLKSVSEGFDAMFWNRLAHVLEHPPVLPGEAACFHPLVLRDIGRLMDREALEQTHSYQAILMGTRRGMPWERAEFWTPAFLMRTAELAEEEIESVRRRFEGTLDTLGCFIPARLKEHAPRGSAVAEMYVA